MSLFIPPIKKEVVFFYYLSTFFINFHAVQKNNVTVVVTASKSDTGSARNTANTLFSKKCGRMYIIGINRIIFLNTARNRE